MESIIKSIKYLLCKIVCLSCIVLIAGCNKEDSCVITKIRYLPRTKGNSIYEGHVYELFYWNWDKWQSLGRQTADSHTLQYKIPFNALLYLRNVTKNRMSKAPFILERGKQQQWI